MFQGDTEIYIDVKNILGIIHVSERAENGERKTREVPATYVAYEEAENGTYKSITGQKLCRLTFSSKRKLLEYEKANGKPLWESDVNPTYRFLERAYPEDSKLPDLRISIYDIEVDRDPIRSYAPPSNPFCPIISITVYHKWIQQAITIAVPPPEMSWDAAHRLIENADHTDGYGCLNAENGYFLVRTETDLLELFLEIIQDTDVLAGWNCMPLSESVWLDDRITTIGECQVDQTVYANGRIKGKKHTGLKDVYDIRTSIGSRIRCSGDHRIPVAIKGKGQYRNYNTISADVRDIRASDLAEITESHDVFVNVAKHINSNACLKFSDLNESDENIPIPENWLRLLGLLFTDGTIGKDGLRIYSSKLEIRLYYGDIVRENDLGTGNWGKPFKNNCSIRIRISKFSPLLKMIHKDGRKHLNLELLSRLSYGQFMEFFSGIIDGDGCISCRSLTVCNFEGQLHTLQELLLWNGVLSTVKAKDHLLRISQDETNRSFIESLTIIHPNRILKEFSTVKRKSSNKQAALYTSSDNYWVKLSVTKTNDCVEMADIETDHHYFYSSGIKVHNCRFYDLPYIINRARFVIGGESLEKIAQETEFAPSEASQKYLRRLSAFKTLPEVTEVEMYGRKERVYNLFGRCHVDYLELYKKFVKSELLSFTLDAILQVEVAQTKVKFDGSIDLFYRNEFRRFLAYNRQDVMGLSAIDDRKRLINMANQMIHMSGVTMDKAVGSVAIIEQAVLRELHRERKEIAWNRKEHQVDKYVPGAFVVDPHAGKYGWGGSYDVNSLYPTMIRLLNISPETMIGQLDTSRTTDKLNEYVDDILNIPPEQRKRNDIHHSYRNNRKDDGIKKAYSTAWHKFTGVLEYHDVIDRSENIVKLVMDKNALTMTGREMHDLIKARNWCITANGTVFDLSREGIIPYCLTKWYNERVEYQKKVGEFKKLAKEAKAEGNQVKAIEYERQAEFYDLVQQSKKLFLNSTYGAYLNRFFRFYDSRCGRSVTLSGRVVVKHMCRKSCELMTGNYDFDRRVILAGDTDSCYISYEHFLDHQGIEKTVDNVVMLGDWIGTQIDNSFVSHLSKQFLVPPERCKIVKVKRETTFDRAIFKDSKKRYALHILDKENERIPKGGKGELKIVGMEVNRSDTPKHIQDFLKECLRLVLVEGHGEEQLREYIEEYRKTFREMPSWKRGSPVRINNMYTNNIKIDQYESAQENHDFSTKKPLTYFAVLAARNTNLLMEKFGENRWDVLRDGDKVDVLNLLPGNDYRMDTVAIRVGEDYVPDWFQQLPFDDVAHEQKLLFQKLNNTFGGLGWDFTARDHTGFDIFT